MLSHPTAHLRLFMNWFGFLMKEDVLRQLLEWQTRICCMEWISVHLQLVNWCSLTWGCLNIKTPFCQYRNYHYKDTTVLRPCYLYNGNPYMQKDWYWDLIHSVPSHFLNQPLLSSIVCMPHNLFQWDLFWFFRKMSSIVYMQLVNWWRPHLRAISVKDAVLSV